MSINENEQLSLFEKESEIRNTHKKYKENCLERSERENVKYKIEQFQQLQNMPYEAKVSHARFVAKDFFKNVTGVNMYANCHVSVGGLDSITLLCFLRSIDIDVPAISVSSLEDISIQRIHKQLGVIKLQPAKDKDGVDLTAESPKDKPSYDLDKFIKHAKDSILKIDADGHTYRIPRNETE